MKPILPWSQHVALERRLQRDLSSFFASYREEVSEDDILQALEDGNYGQLEEELGIGPSGWAIAALVALIIAALRATADDAGRLAALQLGVAYSPNLANSLLETQEAEIRRDLTARANETLAGIIRRGMAAGWSMAMIAATIRRTLWSLDRYAAATQAVAQRMTEEGMAQTRVLQAIDRSSKRGWVYRAGVIASVLVTGVIAKMFQAIWALGVRLGALLPDELVIWLTADDELVCDRCGPLHGVTQKLGELWGSTRADGPPLHPRCRCQLCLARFAQEKP